MPGEFERRFAAAIGGFARERSLTPEFISATLQRDGVLDQSAKRTLKAILTITKDCQGRGRLGTLRASILTGTTLLGPSFITAAERAGVFLSDNMPRRTFEKFLADLRSEAKVNSSNQDWSMLRERLETYCAYQQFAAALADEQKVLRLLRIRPRHIIKRVLALTHVAFLRKYLGFKISSVPGDWLDALGSPEEVASVASILVARANEFLPLDSFDFASPVIGQLATNDMREVMRYGKALVTQHDVAKHLSFFGYRLEASDRGSGDLRVFYLRPPSPAFEYALRLGFIRAEIGWSSIAANVGRQDSIPRFSLQAAAEAFAEKLHPDLCELRDLGTPFRRVRVNIPLDPSLYKFVTERFFYEDFLHQERLSQDFLVPLRHKTEAELRLTDNLDLETFFRLWKHLKFLSLVDISVLRKYDQGDATILLNSLVRVFRAREMIEMVMSMGISEQQAQEFLRLVSADVRNLGYFDLQYRPFLRIASTIVPNKGISTPPEIVLVPAVVAVSNELRNVQSANRIRLESTAKAFVEVIGDILRMHFKKVVLNRRVEVKGGESTDIDVIVLESGVLYLFECKHSVPPTDPHETRDLWEDIEKGTRQLQLAMEALKDPNRLLAYLAGWFPGTKRHDVKALVIKPCVLCSHRIHSGMDHEGIPVRDFGSLAKLAEEGIVGFGRMGENGESLMYRYRIVDQEGFSAADLDNYLSSESKFFKMFMPFMRSISRIERLGKVTIARETYVYEAELREVLAHLEALGGVREPDERKTLTSPWSSEELLSGAEGKPSVDAQ